MTGSQISTTPWLIDFFQLVRPGQAVYQNAKINGFIWFCILDLNSHVSNARNAFDTRNAPRSSGREGDPGSFSLDFVQVLDLLCQEKENQEAS